MRNSDRHFSIEEERLAGQLYDSLESLNRVAKAMHRSPAGIYKVLRRTNVHVNTNVKIPQSLRPLIAELYYTRAMSTNEIRNFLRKFYGIAVSRFSISYALERAIIPIPRSLMELTGSPSLNIRGGLIDMLPFVSKQDLRGVDDIKIHLRFENSEHVMVRRFFDLPNFGRLFGLYAAEGSKKFGPPTFGNCNLGIIHEYNSILKILLSAKVHEYEIIRGGNRQTAVMIRVGGECSRRLFMNALNAIMNHLARPGNLSEEDRKLALKFLSGYAEGDGSVSVRSATRGPNVATLYITEGDSSAARKLHSIFRRVFGKGYLYHPRNRNYYLICLSLAPTDALNLLHAGFFVHSAQMRKRLIDKAKDSRVVRRLVMLYETFDLKWFSRLEVKSLGLQVDYTTINRAARHGILEEGNARPAHEEYVKWYRSFKFTKLGQELIAPLIES